MFRNSSNSVLENMVNLDSNPVVEHIAGCEEAIADFLTGRDIVRMTTFDREHRQNHQMRYEKELMYDHDDEKKGKLALKRYREEFVDPNSKCDALFINNLNMYYGDGSRLNHTAKPHYACDFVRATNGIKSAGTEFLKSLKVSRRKVTQEWLRGAYQSAKSASRLRRSVSCFHICFLERPEDKFLEMRRKSSSSREAKLENCDVDFKIPAEWYRTGANVPRALKYEALCSDIAYAYKMLIRRVHPLKVEKGQIRISKVLFSTEDIYAYVVPALKDQQEEMRKLSREFEFLRGRQPTLDWWKKNTVLYLPEFEKDGTQFRRARHVRKLPSGSHLFIELETGMLRELRIVGAMGRCVNVMLMPVEWARAPAIMEVLFKRAKGSAKVSDRIQEIRRSGVADIAYFERTGPPNSAAESIRDTAETAVILPRKPVPQEKPKVALTRLFCDDKDCMGMCDTDVFFRKPRPSPPAVAPRSSWDPDPKESFDVLKGRKAIELTQQNHISTRMFSLDDDVFFRRTP